MRWTPDEVDRWCYEWAKQRRQIENKAPLEPKDRLGRLNSTLGSIKQDGEGASQGTINQNFPEVYTGVSLLVHRAIREMDLRWAQVVSEHYVNRDLTVAARAIRCGLKVPVYWRSLGFGKNYIHAFVTIAQTMEQKAPNYRAMSFNCVGG